MMSATLAIALAERIRFILGDRPGLVEQKMFGGIAFMQHGNMVVAPMKPGSLLVRVGKAGMEAALARPGAAPMTMSGRTMGGFVEVSADAIEDDDQLAEWLALADAFVASLPPK
jgi:TfoX/Sxy family transcriptional regulator of competence genes